LTESFLEGGKVTERDDRGGKPVVRQKGESADRVIVFGERLKKKANLSMQQLKGRETFSQKKESHKGSENRGGNARRGKHKDEETARSPGVKIKAPRKRKKLVTATWGGRDRKGGGGKKKMVKT